jgi:LmbE family N-acetylglucosaminyl deacetylase
VLLLPLLFAGGASSAYYLRLHRIASGQSVAGLPHVAAPTAGRRILVLAPHCDDETLGVGGMIADARRAGAEVAVAFLTNGDGFRVAASRELREVRLTPHDYVRFAERRQKESMAALRELGVPEARIHFFGYPDRGLESLWEGNWERANPYRSFYTGHIRSPYPRSYTPRAVYCGASLLADVTRLMREVKPTEIYVTHPADDHPDHSAAAAFVQAALLAARDRDEPWARSARLRYYLVHRGDWPLPQGRFPDRPLTPPASLAALDTRWEAYHLSAPARAAKARALGRYESQMAVAGRFLASFVRTNEVYGALPQLQEGAAAVAAAVPDATRDDVVRYAGASADLRSISARQNAAGRRLEVRVRTRGPLSPRVQYALRIRAFDGRETRFLALKLPPLGVRRSVPPGGDPAVAARDQAMDVPVLRVAGDALLQADVPLSALGLSGEGARRVWVSAQTRYMDRVPVDRIGYRPFEMDPTVAETANGGQRRAADFQRGGPHESE